MRSSLLLLAAALASPFASATPSAPPTPRQTVESVARLVAEHYFDEAKGERVAKALRAEAEAGRYDAHRNPTELAAALSQRLQPEDAHFNVLHSAAPPPRPSGAAPARRPSPGEALRRGNFGFRKVEVLRGNIGYIALGGFAPIDFDNPQDPARAQADAALALTRGTDAMVIDVRQSPGGAPEMVGYLVSAFTAPDAKIYNVFHYRGGQDAEAPRQPHPAPRLDVPLYVLTSGRSASAAEGFAYTLQAAKRAEVVGEASAGGANPGGFVDAGGGFRVFVSGGSPVNPITGKNWEGTGVLPDHPVDAADALTKAQSLALQRLLAAADPAAPRLDLQWALQALSAPATPPSVEVLGQLVGQYQGMRVELEAGSLRARRGARGVLMLQPVGDLTFAIEGDASVRAQFIRDEQHTVVAMELLTTDGLRMRFAREG
jgi:hypothetical protein